MATPTSASPAPPTHAFRTQIAPQPSNLVGDTTDRLSQSAPTAAAGGRGGEADSGLEPEGVFDRTRRREKDKGTAPTSPGEKSRKKKRDKEKSRNPSSKSTPTATAPPSSSQPVLVRSYKKPVTVAQHSLQQQQQQPKHQHHGFSNPAPTSRFTTSDLSSATTLNASNSSNTATTAASTSNQTHHADSPSAAAMPLTMTLRKPGLGPPGTLPPISAFAFPTVLASIDPDIRPTIDAIAELCARSRLAPADSYASHRPPVGPGAPPSSQDPPPPPPGPHTGIDAAISTPAPPVPTSGPPDPAPPTARGRRPPAPRAAARKLSAVAERGESRGTSLLSSRSSSASKPPSTSATSSPQSGSTAAPSSSEGYTSLSNLMGRPSAPGFGGDGEAAGRKAREAQRGWTVADGRAGIKLAGPARASKFLAREEVRVGPAGAGRGGNAGAGGWLPWGAGRGNVPGTGRVVAARADGEGGGAEERLRKVLSGGT